MKQVLWRGDKWEHFISLVNTVIIYTFPEASNMMTHFLILYYRHSNIILWLLVVISTHSSLTGFIKGPNPLPWTCLQLLNFRDNFVHSFNSWGWAMFMVSLQWLSAALKWKLCALSPTLAVCKEDNAMDYQSILCSLISLGHYLHPPC